MKPTHTVSVMAHSKHSRARSQVAAASLATNQRETLLIAHRLRCLMTVSSTILDNAQPNVNVKTEYERHKESVLVLRTILNNVDQNVRKIF